MYMYKSVGAKLDQGNELKGLSKCHLDCIFYFCTGIFKKGVKLVMLCWN